jgi:hypothetical protein
MTPVDRLRLAVLLATTLAVATSTAHAQSAEAEVLFRDGRVLIKDGKLAAGCDKLDASARLESSIGTLLNLGDCRERLGKRASAWAAFRKAEAMAKRAGNDPKREGEARRRATQLEPSLSNMIIQVDQRVDGLVIRRDGEVLDVATWNIPVPVDPGKYTIVAEAPGYVAWRAEIPIDPRNRRQVVMVPLLARAPVERVPPASVHAAAPPTVNPAPVPVVYVTTRRSGGTWSTTRKLSLGLAVAGAGAIGGGLYFGARSADLAHQADARCPLAVCTDPEALRLNDKAQTSAMRANIFYAAGGLAVVTAAVMWLAGSPDDETIVTPSIGNGQVGVSFAGSF